MEEQPLLTDIALRASGLDELGQETLLDMIEYIAQLKEGRAKKKKG